jgi:hypothetical protein
LRGQPEKTSHSASPSRRVSPPAAVSSVLPKKGLQQRSILDGDGGGGAGGLEARLRAELTGVECALPCQYKFEALTRR